MSNTGFVTVPFKAEEGFNQVAGLGKFSSAGVVLEYETKIFGIIKSGVKEVRFATDEILDAKFRTGVFKVGAKIEIRLKNFARMTEVPSKNGKIILKISRDDFDRAAEAVLKLQKDLNYVQNTGQLPGSPVSRLFDGSEEETKDLNG